MELGSLFLSGLITAMFSLAIASLVIFLARPRIEQAAFDAAEEYLASKLEQVKENPESISNLLKPALGSLLGELTGTEPGQRPKSLNIAGFKIPPEIYMPFVARFASQLQSGAQNAAIKSIAELAEGKV